MAGTTSFGSQQLVLVRHEQVLQASLRSCLRDQTAENPEVRLFWDHVSKVLFGVDCGLTLLLPLKDLVVKLFGYVNHPRNGFRGRIEPRHETIFVKGVQNAVPDTTQGNLCEIVIPALILIIRDQRVCSSGVWGRHSR